MTSQRSLRRKHGKSHPILQQRDHVTFAFPTYSSNTEAKVPRLIGGEVTDLIFRGWGWLVGWIWFKSTWGYEVNIIITIRNLGILEILGIFVE